MAYETGTATSVTDLLDKMRIFATANGWTQDFFGARTSGSGTALQLTKGGHSVTFIADTGTGTTSDPGPYFGCYSHNAYSAGNGTENQSQGSTKTFANGMAGPFVAYHLITGSERGAEYLYAIVEVSSGVVKHVGIGKLVALGALTPGTFAFASRWTYTSTSNTIGTALSPAHSWPFDSAENAQRLGPGTQIRADSDGISPRWYDGSGSVSYGNRFGGGVRQAGSTTVGPQRGTVVAPIAAGVSALTGRTLLVPCWVYGERTANLGSPLGYPPHIRWVRLDYLNPGDIMTIGSDQWKVFPVIRKNGGTGVVNSDTYGYAYKIN